MYPTLKLTLRIIALPLLAWAVQPYAVQGQGGAPSYRPALEYELGRQIAEQGNQALLQIRSELRPQLQLPQLQSERSR